MQFTVDNFSRNKMERCKSVHIRIVDIAYSCRILENSLSLQQSASIQPRTSPPKFVTRTLRLRLTLPGFLFHSPGTSTSLAAGTMSSSSTTSSCWTWRTRTGRTWTCPGACLDGIVTPRSWRQFRRGVCSSSAVFAISIKRADRWGFSTRASACWTSARKARDIV